MGRLIADDGDRNDRLEGSFERVNQDAYVHDQVYEESLIINVFNSHPYAFGEYRLVVPCIDT